MLNITKVLISDKVDSSCKDIFEKNGVSTDYKPGLNKDELKAIIAEYDALIVRSATKVTEDVFQCATKLKLVGRAGTGVDNIDLKAASKHGVLVMNTPGGNTLSAAEHTCALIASIARHIGQGYASMLEGKWERSKFMGNELKGKTLAIVGLGRIGREVASRMQAYGMTTIGFDPMVTKEEAEACDIEYLSLEEIWPRADFITVHTPLIPQTKGMINASVFKVCKPTVKVINVARGGIIDEDHLLEALNNGTCGGAALDVFVTEPPQGVSLDLVKHPKVIATPHLGASTSEAQLRVAGEISQQIVDGIQAKPLVGLVNAPALSQSSNPAYRPWIELAEKLGKLTASLIDEKESVTEVTVITKGDSLRLATGLVNAAFSCGMAKRKDTTANLINAKSLLNDDGLMIKMVHCKEGEETSVTACVGEKMLCTGVISGGLPALMRVHCVKLTSPVALTTHLVVGKSEEESAKKDMMLLLSNIDVTSLSVGVEGRTFVIAATYNCNNGVVIKEPLVPITL